MEIWHLLNPQKIILESNNNQYSYRKKKKGILINKMCIYFILFLKQKERGRGGRNNQRIIGLTYWVLRTQSSWQISKWEGEFLISSVKQLTYYLAAVYRNIV